MNWSRVKWLQKKTSFCDLDLCSSYWQFSLDPQSYDACDLIASQGNFMSTWVFHGLNNAPAYFQPTIPPLFEEMKHATKTRIDDLTMFTKTEPNLREYLGRFLVICNTHILYLSAKNSVLYTKEVKRCGRIIDSEEKKLHPRNIDTMRFMKDPINAAELRQLIHCCRWVSTSIPDFLKGMQPLDNAPEKGLGASMKV